MTVVAAAIVERAGRILICRRRLDQDHPGKWEFPGGKLERGEDSAAALRRELREELNIAARIGREIARRRHAYPGRPPIELIFHRVTQFRGEPDPAQFEQVLWVEPQRLPDFDFLDGDVDLIRELAAGKYLLFGDSTWKADLQKRTES